MKIQDYRTQDGIAGTSVSISMNDMPTSHSDFPVHIRAQAEAGAALLQNLLADIAEEQRVQRDLVTGARLDPRKRRAVGTAMRRGVVDPYELRPYQRRESVPAMPSVGIVASAGVSEVGHMVTDGMGNNGHLSGDRMTYAMRVTQLTLTVAWALQAVQADVTAALCEGHLPKYLRHSSGYARAQLGYMLVEPGDTVPLKAYSCFQNVERFYGETYRRMYGQQRDYAKLCAKLRGEQKLYWGGSFPSDNGGHAVDWMRQVYAPDIVISIGKNSDKADADIQIDVWRDTTQDIIRKIAREIRSQLQD